MLLGSRQVGKITLALDVAEDLRSIYLDLEADADRMKLQESALYLSDHGDKLVVIDEVQRLPDLFQSLRGLIDHGRRRTGKKSWAYRCYFKIERMGNGLLLCCCKCLRNFKYQNLDKKTKSCLQGQIGK